LQLQNTRQSPSFGQPVSLEGQFVRPLSSSVKLLPLKRRNSPPNFQECFPRR
jgi:hypothetical protein